MKFCGGIGHSAGRNCPQVGDDTGSVVASESLSHNLGSCTVRKWGVQWQSSHFIFHFIM